MFVLRGGLFLTLGFPNTQREGGKETGGGAPLFLVGQNAARAVSWAAGGSGVCLAVWPPCFWESFWFLFCVVSSCLLVAGRRLVAASLWVEKECGCSGRLFCFFVLMLCVLVLFCTRSLSALRVGALLVCLARGGVHGACALLCLCALRPRCLSFFLTSFWVFLRMALCM